MGRPDLHDGAALLVRVPIASRSGEHEIARFRIDEHISDFFEARQVENLLIWPLAFRERSCTCLSKRGKEILRKGELVAITW